MCLKFNSFNASLHHIIEHILIYSQSQNFHKVTVVVIFELHAKFAPRSAVVET